jgi:hypothetical protein
MTIGFPDGVPRGLHDLWRERLLRAQQQYEAERNQETIATYKTTLKVFADLVLRGKIPENGDLARKTTPASA